MKLISYITRWTRGKIKNNKTGCNLINDRNWVGINKENKLLKNIGLLEKELSSWISNNGGGFKRIGE